MTFRLCHSSALMNSPSSAKHTFPLIKICLFIQKKKKVLQKGQRNTLFLQLSIWKCFNEHLKQQWGLCFFQVSLCWSLYKCIDFTSEERMCLHTRLHEATFTYVHICFISSPKMNASWPAGIFMKTWGVGCPSQLPSSLLLFLFCMHDYFISSLLTSTNTYTKNHTHSFRHYTKV